MSIYLITLIIGNINVYLISTRKHEFLLNLISLVIISIIAVILIYFTFNPLKNDFFFDSIEEIYGIKNQNTK